MGIGHKIIHLESVDSTNNYTANLLKEGKIDSGTVILADDQFAGRGQRSAEWLVKPGENLTFSVFLDDVNLSVESQFLLSQHISLVLVQWLAGFNIEAKIKWPNDIYVGNQKISGILIENQLSFGRIKSAIIGIGVNINQTEFKGFNATSIKKVSGKSLLIREALFSFISAFNKIDQSRSLNNSELLKTNYLKELIGYGQILRFEDSNGVFEGQIIDVKANGKIVVKNSEEEKEYDLKELSFIF